MENQTFVKTLIISNQINELSRVELFLEELGEEWDLNPGLVYSINLAIEEALTNTISYGYDDTEHHEIELDFSKTGSQLTINIQDDGHPYDPTSKEDPDITLSAEDRPIGGLGIFLIKKLMDQVEYRRSNDRNHLILTKSI
jgi:serine/threonine-protein kinase RsbW